MLKKHTKHTGHAQLQLDYHYKTADFKKSKGEKNSFEKSQDSRRVLVLLAPALGSLNVSEHCASLPELPRKALHCLKALLS